MQRESNLELCRIISMVMIVLNHVVSLGEVLDGAAFNGNTFVSLFYLLGGKFGTNVFVIIGLYFLVEQKCFKSQKVIRIWLQTLFYLLAMNIFDVLVFSSQISFRTWVVSFLPVFGRSYWFASSYIILLMLLPLLNKIYERLNVGWRHILTGTVIFSILPTLTFDGRLFGDSVVFRLAFKLLMFGPVWFSYLYFVIRYLKTHLKLSGGGIRRYAVIFVCAYGLMFLTEIFLYRKGIEGNEFMGNNFSTIRDMSSFPCLIAAGSFFMIFKNLRIRHNQCINSIASTTFGIYLLHNHETTIPIFWRGIFRLNTMSKTPWYLPYSLLLVVAIFGVGMMVEYVRKKAEHIFLDSEKSRTVFERIDHCINTKFGLSGADRPKKGCQET